MYLKARGNSIQINGKSVCISVEFYSGKTYNGVYDRLVAVNSSSYRGFLTLRNGAAECKLVDTWEINKESVFVKRQIEAKQISNEYLDGVQATLEMPLQNGKWVFFIPAACYKECPVEEDKSGAVLMEERLPYPLVLAYDELSGQGFVLLRCNPAIWSESPKRAMGDYSFLHATDLGGLGYRHTSSKDEVLIACFPYREGPISRALDRTLHPLSAFLPVDCKRVIEVTYELKPLKVSDYCEACISAFRHAFTAINPQPVELPFTIDNALRYRVQCLADLGRTWDEYTGLKLNFDPGIGIDAPPTGFGREFNKITSDIFTNILEYGFTGRQLNNAYVLMYLGQKWNKSEWINLGKQLVDSYVTHCSNSSGFLYTLYDVERRRPFHPFGDPKGMHLHYGIKDAYPGNYLRNMSEAAYDLSLCYRLKAESPWLKVALNFGQFLKRVQNQDGSWYRAYTTEGKPINKPEKWFGYTSKQQKSATAVTIPCLVYLHEMAPEYGFLYAAEKAGHWLLTESVALSDYRGGTLDNPNIVDKESMGYAMAGLLSLYEQTGNLDYLKGAQKAGGLALTWNYIWDVPFEPGSRLHENNFKTRGWGGIDILWAGSVVDIYSLWFIKDWYRLTDLTGEKMYEDLAQLIVKGTQQLLAHPNNLHGLKAPGMQEEGFACSNWGLYEGMIKKGDTWGSLGWVYAAGTYGLLQFLMRNVNITSK